MLEQYRKSDKAFVIAEVGQNHNGDVHLAIEYIRTFSRCGANAIKFQTRNNRTLFSEEAYNSIYNSENAYGQTYGEHREKLELSVDDLCLLRDECKKQNVYFMSTAFDEPSLELLKDVGVELLKVASFDLGNIPFLHRIGLTGLPVIMSTGGGSSFHIEKSVETIKHYHNNLAILHCVSEYPCDFSRLGLSEIKNLLTKFSDITVGSSDHFNGILSGPIAFMLGARVFEKHVTLNRSWKGTDHSFALEPSGFTKFVRDLRRTPDMLPAKNDGSLGQEGVFKKLGKSLVANCDIEKDQVIQHEMLTGRIFNQTYMPVRDASHVIGLTTSKPIKCGEPLTHDNMKTQKV